MSRYLRAGAAATVLLVLLAAIPAGLVAMFANPLPGWGDVYAGDVSDTALLDVLATIVWLGWAQFSIAVARETLALLRHTPRPHITGLLPGQRLARTLVTAVFLIGPTAAPVFAAPPASAATPVQALHLVTVPRPGQDPPPTVEAVPRPVSPTPTSTAFSPRGSPTPHPIPGTRPLIIGNGGPFTFWDLADRYLGAGERWREIWHLNQGRTQPDGTVMTNPRWFLTGWSVLIPDTPPPPKDNPSRSPGTGSDSTARRYSVASSNTVTVFGLGAGAGLLAGVSLSELARRRNTQSRHRRPGRVPASTPPELAATERQLRLHGPYGQQNATALDYALRILARDLTHAGARPPDVTAVRISRQRIDLLLNTRQPPPGTRLPQPWQLDPGTGQWRSRLEPAPQPEQQQLRRTQVPPFPALVSIGTTRTPATSATHGATHGSGEHWLLDLEAVKVLRLTGDQDRCRDLTRFMIAELANNTWSELLQVTVVGFESGLAGVNGDRITCTNDVGEAVADLHHQLQLNREVLHANAIGDVLEGRFHDIAGDMWYPHILVIHPDILTADPNPAHTMRQITDLASELTHTPGRVGLALVLAHDLPAPQHSHQSDALSGTRLHIDAEGQMLAPSGQTLTAACLPAQAAAQLAGVLVAAADTHDRPTPPARGQHPWDALADATGAPRIDLTTAQNEGTSAQPRHAPTGPGTLLRVVTATTGLSVLGMTPASILDSSASTTRDITALAPQISPDTRRRIHDADPTLDADLAAWHNPHTDRARLSLLGPVQVRALGSLPARRPREPWYTEVVAYLAAHPRGVTSEQFGTDLWPNDPDIASKPKLRQAVFHARSWLATDPQTGGPYIPAADDALRGGLGTYRVDGLLTDADLFRRLRLRGVSAGPQGITDLLAALDLVTGPPFDGRRRDGYTWLVDTPLDVEYTAMIVDVAHLVATHYLTTDRPALAAAAARVSLTAGSQDDTPLLDLVAACDAQGLHAEATAWVRQILSTHGAEVEEDLCPRTAEILHRRQWPHRIS